ncbi:hypothetical protein OKW26_001683 [Paraburkholderia sp. 32]
MLNRESIAFPSIPLIPLYNGLKDTSNNIFHFGLRAVPSIHSTTLDRRRVHLRQTPRLRSDCIPCADAVEGSSPEVLDSVIWPLLLQFRQELLGVAKSPCLGIGLT